MGASTTNTELVEAAAGLFDTLRANAEQADMDRQLPKDSVQAIQQAGLFRVWNARRYGGHEADIKTQVLITRELARACSSSGWVTGVITGSHWMAHSLTDEATAEIWGENPDALVSGNVTPHPVVVPETDGGYVISGRWGFGSGGGHSDWLYMPILVMEDGAPNVRFCFAPRSEFTIEDTWHVLGMRGTGSNTMVADNVFVPEHRTYALLGPKGAMEGVTRKGHQDEELYRCPFGMLGGATLVGTFLGIAEAAFDHMVATLPARPISYSNYLTSSSSVGTQLDIAEARTRLDMATLLAFRLADDCTAAGRAGALPNNTLRARARHDCAVVARETRAIVDLLARLGGASGAAEGSLLNRLYRDISTASLHGVTNTATTQESYGAALLGEPITNTSFI